MDIEFIEEQIIGLLLINNDNNIYINNIEEYYFQTTKNKLIFSAIKQTYKNKEDINIINIAKKLNGNLKELINITDLIVVGSNIEYNIELLKNHYRKTKTYNILNNNIKDLKENNVVVDDLIRNLRNDLNSLQENNKISFENIDEVFIKTLTELEEQSNKKDDKSLYTGFYHLDNLNDGLHNGELTCIGARPGTGKTALALNIGNNIAKKNKSVYFCSLEMNSTQLMQRLISQYTRINTQLLRNAQINKEEYIKIASITQEITKLNLKIDCKSRFIEDLEIEVIKLKEKNSIDVLIIDYLTLLKCKEKFNSRELEVADISRRLKLLALDMNIPVIILVQLNRDAENKVPTMANIRESGSIEQNCDNIIFLHSADTERSATENIYLTLEKQRQGCTGTIMLKFYKKYSTFVSIER